MTIPVHTDSLSMAIRDVKVSDQQWARKHWASICQNYSRSRYFNEYKEPFEELYLNRKFKYLCDINHSFILLINRILGIKTKIRHSSEFVLYGKKADRLFDLLRQVNTTSYLTGPKAKEYLSEAMFEKENMTVEWMDYSEYPEYNQLYPPFEHTVSIIDLIFNEGPGSIYYMKSFEPVYQKISHFSY